MASMLPSQKKPLPPSIGLDEIQTMERRLNEVIESVRESMLAPTAKKVAPLYGTNQLAYVCGIEKAKITYRLKKGDLPSGHLNEKGSKREWTLPETRVWAQACRPEKLRPKDTTSAAVICVANFKGGVAKTTTTATIAQGLSLRGHSVLVIDLDAQGSLSELFGIRPPDVTPEQTVLGLFQGTEDDLSSAVRPSYWDGVDIVAASTLIFDAEFALPVRQMKDPRFDFWAVLDGGLDALRDKYDVILIDTPPSLSYTTMNALMAADGLVIPVPPNTLDFASSAQFWRLYVDTCEPIRAARGVNKHYNFVNVLMTRVDNQESMSGDVRRWIMSAYGDSVLPIEIPKTSIASTASAEFGTAYDVSDAMIGSKTFKRAIDAYERLVEVIEEQVIGIWTHQSGSKA